MNVWRSLGYSLIESLQQPNVAVVLLWRLDQEGRFQNEQNGKKYYIRYLSGNITDEQYNEERANAIDFLEGRKLYCHRQPTQAHWYDAGFDLHLGQDYVFKANQPTEIIYKEHILVPHGYVGLLMARSSTNCKGNLRSGVVDPTYTGVLQSTFTADRDINLTEGTAVAQLVLLRCETSSLLPISSTSLPNYGRGSGNAIK